LNTILYIIYIIHNIKRFCLINYYYIVTKTEKDLSVKHFVKRKHKRPCKTIDLIKIYQKKMYMTFLTYIVSYMYIVGIYCIHITYKHPFIVKSEKRTKMFVRQDHIIICTTETMKPHIVTQLKNMTFGNQSFLYISKSYQS